MATTNAQSLYTKYCDEYGVAPKAEYFIKYCKKHAVNIRYKECRQLLQNPPSTPKDSIIHTTDSSGDQINELKEEDVIIKYDDTPDNNEQTPSPSPTAEITNIKKSTSPSKKYKHFQLLNASKRQSICEPVRLSMDASGNVSSNYVSPEILIDQMIPLNENNQNIISFHRDHSDQTHINKQYLFRDFILFILYWFGLINGIFVFFDFNLWYFRYFCLFLWDISLLISLLSHIYYPSPPFYSQYGQNYIPKFEQNAIEYIKKWKEKELKLKLFFIEMFGSLSESQCGFVEINAKKIEDKSSGYLDEIIEKDNNKMIRLRVYHILRFHDVDSHNKFMAILKNKQIEIYAKSKKAETMYHIEYDEEEFEERLIMNTTRDGITCWNKCCTNRTLSYFFYVSGLGIFYRLYHDFCIKVHVYDCVKEVTL